ncbi:MAG TPA: rRNA maturation RNase YbeY [Candidatus Binatia bacterium]|nr:rRNA maturation RNase YbeY [Candidatus Binatia bacterium]
MSGADAGASGGARWGLPVASVAAAERRRSLYRPPWRIDLVVRAGVPRLVPEARLADLLAEALAAAGAPRPAAVGLLLTGDAEIADLKGAHLGEFAPTDVLSFPLLPPEAFPAHEPDPDRGRSPLVGGSAADLPAEGFVLPPGRRVELGDIVVSVERAIDQARSGRGGQTGDRAWAPADELRLLVVHGVLHLCGWDHADPEEGAAMRALERRLLGISASGDEAPGDED